VSEALVIRDARTGDEAAIHSLLWEFAEFEKLTHRFQITREIISRDFIGEKRRVQCDVAEWDGAIAGMMIWYRIYGTFEGVPGLFLEDVFVRPAFRRRGIGKAFLRQLVRYAIEENANRIDWCVLDWNTPAMDFYDGIGARAVSEWRVYRLCSDAFHRLADT
jgi:GNAT superfamily N-acetyltransferase